MLINGLNYRKNKNYTWRNGNPEIDKDINNSPLERSYIAFMKVKDCDIVKIDDIDYLDNTKVPSIKLEYGLTHQGYTEFEKKTSKLGEKVFDSENKNFIICKEYLECKSFYLHQGEVYTAIIRKPIK